MEIELGMQFSIVLHDDDPLSGSKKSFHVKERLLNDYIFTEKSHFIFRVIHILFSTEIHKNTLTQKKNH